MYEHRHGGLSCEGSAHETEECNAWMDTKSDLLACQAKSENSTTELARLKKSLARMQNQITELQQMLGEKTEQSK